MTGPLATFRPPTAGPLPSNGATAAHAARPLDSRGPWYQPWYRTERNSEHLSQRPRSLERARQYPTEPGEAISEPEGRRFESGPRYVLRDHRQTLSRQRVFGVKGPGDILRDRRRDLYAAFGPIDGNLKVESLKDLALDLRRCRPEAFAEVRDGRNPPFQLFVLGFVPLTRQDSKAWR